MAAANTDLFRKGTNTFSTTLSAGIGAADTTISLSSTTNLPTDTAIDLVIDRVDANGNKTPATREYITGVVSGTTITNVLRGKGNSTAQTHLVGAVVEFVFDQNTWNDAVSGIVQDHAQINGGHKQLTDTNGNIVLGLTPTTSAVNYAKVTNATSGNGPTISADGSNTNVDLNLAAKGTGLVKLPAANKTTDANGWTVYNYGGWTEYCKYVTWTGSQSIASLNIVDITLADSTLPVGFSSLSGAFVSTSMGQTSDRAVHLYIDVLASSTSLTAHLYNPWNATLTITGATAWVRILK